jgi:mono/diheme cytochrome c family protein
MKNKIIRLLTGSMAATIAVGALRASPAWSSDSPREWKTPSTASERKNPVPPDHQSMAAGRAIYERECASCHGAGGKGDGKEAMDLTPRPADLSSPVVTGQSDGALFWKVTTGRRPMPAFRKDLTDEERWHVVNFIRTLTARK